MSFQKYEQYGKIRSVEYMADEVADLQELPNSAMGSTCYVIANATTYMCNSKQEWIAQNKPVDNSGSGSAPAPDLSNYMTKDEVNAAIVAATANSIKAEDLITINGQSLIGDGDINIASYIPDEDIVSEEELNNVIDEALTIEQIG